MITVKNKGRSQMKSRNTIKVYKHIMENNEISRSDISKNLKISFPTISRITNKLIQHGLLNESGSEDTSLGRKPVNLSINKEYGYIIGANLTRTKLNIVICDMSLNIKNQRRIILPEIENETHLLECVGDNIEAFIKPEVREKIIGIGIASRDEK